jgi:hypothetical protein
MASEEDLKQFARQQNVADSDDSQQVVADLPPYPEALKRRFPEMQVHEAALKEWVKKLIIALRGGFT